MEDNRLSDSQRIERVIRYLGMTMNAFSRSIGLNRSENLYQIKNGKHGISKELADQITTRYGDISKAWLLTGEGEMLSGLNTSHFNIQCYDADVLGIVGLDKLPTPNYILDIPRFSGASFAACSFDRAMDARIPVGSTVVLRRIEQDEIVPGHDYVIITGQMSLLRTLHRQPYACELRLSAPDDQYDDLIMDINDIKALYRVMGYIYYSK